MKFAIITVCAKNRRRHFEKMVAQLHRARYELVFLKFLINRLLFLRRYHTFWYSVIPFSLELDGQGINRVAA